MSSLIHPPPRAGSDRAALLHVRAASAATGMTAGTESPPTAEHFRGPCGSGFSRDGKVDVAPMSGLKPLPQR